MNKLLLFLISVAVSALAQNPAPPIPVKTTLIYNIRSTTILDCGTTRPACIDNRSAANRQNDYHSYRASGTGTWSIDMQWADSFATGPWTSYGSTGQVSNVSPQSAIGYGIDPVSLAPSGKRYHDFIRFVFTGSATIENYVGLKDIWSLPSAGSISFPLTVNQGGTGLSVPIVVVDRLYVSIAAACSAATLLGAGIAITGPWTAMTNQTISCPIIGYPGGSLQPASGQTLTISGPISVSPGLNIFDLSAGGLVVAGSNMALLGPLSVENFGAVPDGATDSTAAIQGAFKFFGSAGAGSPRSGKLLMPGDLVISDTIAIKNFSGVVDCQGAGTPGEASPVGNYIKWKTGASGGIPMFKYDNTHNMAWQNCKVLGNAANAPSAAFNCASGAYGGGAANQNNTFSNIQVGDVNSSANELVNGFLADGDNANCDSHRLENVNISHTQTAGINLTRTQNVDWSAHGLTCAQNTGACAAIAGTLTVTGGSMAGNSVDWLFKKDSSGSNSNPIIHIIGVVADGSGRWASDGGVAFGAGTFTSEGGTYNVTDAAGAISDGACGPSSNTSLYTACTFFLKFNTASNMQVDIENTQINTNLASNKAMLNFGSPTSGDHRAVRVHSINATCPSWNTTNFLISIAAESATNQYYEFDTSCDGGWRTINGPSSITSIIQPYAGIRQTAGTNAFNATCTGTCTLDLANGLTQSFSVTGNVASWTFSNFAAGGFGRLSLTICSSGGSFTVASPTYFGGQTFGQWGFTSAITVNTCAQQQFEFTGTGAGRNQAINSATAYRTGIAP